MTAEPITTFETGSQPARVIRCASAEDYLAVSSSIGPHLVIGGGSNLVLADERLPYTLVVLARPGSGVMANERGRVVLDAAGNWDATVLDTGSRNLAGLETLAGIPGTVGGAIVQNVGAYGPQVGEFVRRVQVLQMDTGSVDWIDAKACGFEYRNSVFKASEPGTRVVLRVELELSVGGLHRPIYDQLVRALEATAPGYLGWYRSSDVRLAVRGLRREKDMLWSRNDDQTRGAGSFFVNPVVSAEKAAELGDRFDGMWCSCQEDGQVKLSAGWLVEASGYLRGHRWPSVSLAKGHALGLVNSSGAATSAEVIAAANEVAAAVTANTGIRLRAEPILMGFPEDLPLHFDAHQVP